MKKRLFVAIEIPGKIKEKIIALQKNFDSQSDDVSWVKPENMHLTLVFLGDTDYNQIPNIIACLERLKDDAFEVSLAEIGGFPNLDKAHTLWIGVRNNLALSALFYLREKIAKCLRGLSLNVDEKNFIPHITIARFKKRREVKLKLGKNLGKFEAREFILFDSTLTQEGAKHKIIKKFPLR